MTQTMHVQSETNVKAKGDEPGRPRVRARTCIGCGERQDILVPNDLVRLILGPDGDVTVDLRGGAGRGARVHARRSCVERAARGGLLRVTKGRARVVRAAGGSETAAPGGDAEQALGVDSLARAIGTSLEGDVHARLATGIRSGEVTIGLAAVREFGLDGKVRRMPALLVVACDAPEVAALPEVQAAVADGRAVAWGSKELLGALSFRARREAMPNNGVGVLAIVSETIAMAIRRGVQGANAVLTAEPATSRPTNRTGPRGRAARNPAGSGRANDARADRRHV